jgi:hypothetical protein
MQNREFLLYLRRRRPWFLSFAAIVFIATLSYMHFINEHGYAEVSFQLQGAPFVLSTETEDVYRDLFQSEAVVTKQRILVFSDEMLMYLIGKFNLYKHYHIDPSSENAYERVTRAINSRLFFDYKMMRMFTLSYRDRDKDLAAKILNGVVEKLNLMNQSEVDEIMRANVDIYSSLTDDLLAALEKKKLTNDEYINMYGQLHTRNENSQELAIKILQTERLLDQQASEIWNLKRRLKSTDVKHQVNEKNINSIKSPIINVLMRPIPRDMEIWYQSLLIAIAASCMALALAAGILYYYNYYSWEFSTLFGIEKISEPNDS